MSEKKYLVADTNGVLARGMNLDDALMFMKAYCEKYYMEFIDLYLHSDFCPNCGARMLKEGETDD